MAKQKPTWQNTLSQDTCNSTCSGYRFGWRDDMAMAAYNIGYPYIAWNGRVYSVSMYEVGKLRVDDTNIYAEDLQ